MEKTEWKRIMQEEFIKMQELRERLIALSNGDSRGEEDTAILRQQWILATRKHVEAWKKLQTLN